MAKREAAVADYAADWARMVGQWRAPRATDAVWLMYAANYLLNTRGLKWAVDPVRLSHRVPEARGMAEGRDLRDLEFILLTHAHSDHADLGLWSQIRESGCHWVVPEHMAELFAGPAGMGRARHSIAIPGREIVLPGARIMPFDAPHGDSGAGRPRKKVPATGYRVETAGGVWLFPGDIRTYDPLCLAPFAAVSAVFAHVFLGRSAALASAPPLVDAFIKFHLACRPKKIVLAHLYEFAREPADCWGSEHAEIIARALAAAGASAAVIIPAWFRETPL